MKRELFTAFAVLFFTFSFAKSHSIAFSFIERPDGLACVVTNFVLAESQEIIYEQSEGISEEDVKLVEVTGGSVPVIITELFRRFSNVQLITISFSGLERVQSGAFENALALEAFVSSGNPLKVLEANAFSGATNLISVDLSYNDLEAIDSTAFHGLDKLQYLNLAFNNLVNVDPAALRPLKKLLTLQIQCNKIQKLDGNLISGMTNLTEIHAFNNRITAIGREFLDDITDLLVFDTRLNICDSSEWYMVPIHEIHAGLENCYKHFELGS